MARTATTRKKRESSKRASARGIRVANTKAKPKPLKIPSVWELSERAIKREYHKQDKSLAAEGEAYRRFVARWYVARRWIERNLRIEAASAQVAGQAVKIPLWWDTELTPDYDATDIVGQALMPGFRKLLRDGETMPVGM